METLKAENAEQARTRMMQELLQRYTESQRLNAEQKKLLERFCADNSKQYDDLTALIQQNADAREREYLRQQAQRKADTDRIISEQRDARRDRMKARIFEDIVQICCASVSAVGITVSLWALVVAELLTAFTCGLIAILADSAIAVWVTTLVFHIKESMRLMKC